MKDKLEKFILNNREAFDFREPDPGMWNKIKSGIRPRKTIRFKFILSRAAAVLLIFVISYMINKFIYEGFPKISFSRSKEIEIPELKEAENYYTGVLNEKLNEIKPILAACPALEEELNYDLNQLDSLYRELKNDLKDNIANQEVIDAMIQNYRLRISILEEISSEIKPDKDGSDKKYNCYEL
jgi:hypothetical protein